MKIAILGSTGSIGKTTVNILKKNKRNFNIVLLTTNCNNLLLVCLRGTIASFIRDTNSKTSCFR